MSIVTMRARLTEADVRTLVKGQDEDDRAAAAGKIARLIDHSELTGEERAYAEAILRIIAADAAERVRRSLAVALRQSPKLPADVARRLAEDVESVALPILQGSPALSDRDLIELLRSAPPNRQIAIASRDRLSAAVTDMIAEVGAPEALERALANDNAEFTERGLGCALDRMSERPSLVETMVRRRVLPVSVVEKLVAIVTGEVFDYLVNHHELPPQLAIDIAAGARERATVDLIVQASLQKDLRRFVQQLNLHGRLTPSLLMRGLCSGQIEFLEHAFAELAGLTHHKAWRLLHDAGPLGLRTLFERAALPTKIYPAFRAALDLHHQLERENETLSPELRRQRMIERTLTLFRAIPREDLDYLMDKLDAAERIVERAAGG